MIRLLIVYRDYLDDNLYVQTLRDGLRKAGCRVECSCEKFWSFRDEYDIVHVQWPEELFLWGEIDDAAIRKLNERILEIKSRGIKIVYTRHNTVPHYANAKVTEVYQVLERAADGIVHMGQFSLEEIRRNGNGAQALHVVIPHHIYENIYNESITKEEARMFLGIPAQAFVICVFGKFRNREEVKLVLKAFLSSRIKHKYLLAPRILLFSSNTRLKKIFSSFVRTGLRLLGIRAGNYEALISNAALPYYISACDMLMVQRTHILNSGNVPLAFLFKKVVAGPAVGNVGELLKQSGNPVFYPEDDASVARALQEGYRLAGKGHGMQNYMYACNYMSLHRVAGMYLDFYKKLLGENAELCRQ